MSLSEGDEKEPRVYPFFLESSNIHHKSQLPLLWFNYRTLITGGRRCGHTSFAFTTLSKIVVNAISNKVSNDGIRVSFGVVPYSY